MAIAISAPADGHAQAGRQADDDGRRSMLADAGGQSDGLALRYGSALLFLLLALIPAWLAAQRSYLGYGTETDFLGNFIPEAQRILTGEPLIVAFHPPLYPAVIALGKSVLGDWLTAGLAVSVLAALAGAIATFWLVRGLLGPAAALGALSALLGSHVFLGTAAQATSDTLYFALFCGCCALALAAIESGRASAWRLLGLVLGAALLTRTNAAALLLLLAAPWFRDGPCRRPLEDSTQILAAAAIPLIAWCTYALATGSPALPIANHINLALTYFAPGPDRMSADAFATVTGRFDGLLDVLLHDPGHLVGTYISDLGQLITAGIPQLIASPLRLLFLPGLVLLVLLRGGERRLWLFGLVLAAQVVLVNFKAFEARYYLFVLPALGAGVGAAIEAMLRAHPSTPARRAAAACVVVGAIVLGVAHGVATAYAQLLGDQAELDAAVPAARQFVQPGEVVVARKPHLSFYTGARFVMLARTTELGRLREQLCAWSDDGGVHLFYGKVEQVRRAGFREPLLIETPPPWLEVEAASKQPGEWVLFRLRGCDPTVSAKKRQGSIGPWPE